MTTPHKRGGRSSPSRSCAALAQSIADSLGRQEPLIRRRLERLESRLRHAPEPLRSRAGEQIAVIQVGLTCLSEAVGDLAAELRDSCPTDAPSGRA